MDVFHFLDHHFPRLNLLGMTSFLPQLIGSICFMRSFSLRKPFQYTVVPIRFEAIDDLSCRKRLEITYFL